MDSRKLQRAINLYSNTVYKVAMVILKNPHDADDALQETFLRYYKKDPQFESAEHERNWFTRCAVNTSKNLRKSLLHYEHEPLTDHVAAPSPGSLPDLLFRLPKNDRILLQLYHVEGYTSEELGAMMHATPAAIRKRLERARQKARKIYQKEYV